MRTPASALNAQLRQTLDLTHTDAATVYVHETLQLQGDLNHAAVLRTTFE